MTAAVTHSAHAMSHTAHSTHAVEPCMSRSEARAVTDTSCRRHSITVASAHVRSAFPMNAVVLAVDSLRVLRMRGCPARAVRVAYKLAETLTVIVRNFSPALPALMLRNKVLETVASGVRQQMSLLQATPAKAGGRPLRLECFDRNSGCSRHSVQVRCARNNRAQHQNKPRYDYT